MKKLYEKQIKYLKSLHTPKGVKKNKEFLVEGYHLVEEAIKHGVVKEIFSTNEEVVFNKKATLINSEDLSRITSTKTPQGVVALCKILPSHELNNFENSIILNNVQDPGNVGTILRSAVSFGWKQVILTPGCASIYNNKTIMASQGAIFKVKIIYKTVEEIIEIKDTIELISTVLNEHAIELKKFQKTTAKPLSICFGNEGSGVEKAIINNSTPVYINIDDMESLNVAIAAGICLYELN